MSESEVLHVVVSLDLMMEMKDMATGGIEGVVGWIGILCSSGGRAEVG